MPKPAIKARTLSLILSLSLLAACGGSPAAPESPPPPEPPVSASPAPAEPERPDGILPQEDPERPGALAGTRGYYTPGHRLTLYAMAPESGELRVARENDFWNGREVEDVSPSGKWLLLSSWDGAPSRRVVALSLYDLERDLLVNLAREEETAGDWGEKHWFPGGSYYCFTDEDTFYYRRFCYCGEHSQPHLHRFDIGEDGQVTASLIELECPPREEGWESGLTLLPEKGQAFCLLRMGEDSWEWLTWDMASGKLLSRTPGENGWGGGLYRDGVFYGIREEWEQETFCLTAYLKDTDTLEVLASGIIPKAPGMEDQPWDSRGVLERVWVEEVEEGGILLRSSGEYPDYYYRESFWDLDPNKTIRFGEAINAPTFPVDGRRGYTPVFVTGPEGEGLYLPLPQGMAEHYQNSYERPYPLAWLETGELLLLAVEVDTLPQEDPERPGALAGCDSCYGHWRTLYAVDPATGGHRVVRESNFWNGLETAAASPSGSRLLLATGNSYNSAGIPLVAALSVYDIQQDRLTDLSRPAGEEMTYGGRWMDHSHWFPNRHGYRFLDEDTIVCQELFYSPAAPEEGRLWFWDIAPDGSVNWRALRLECPPLDTKAYGGKWARGCIFLPEDGSIRCRVPTLERGWEWLAWDGESGKLLSRSPGEDSAPGEATRPEPPRFPEADPLLERWREDHTKYDPYPIPIARLPTGELLFLAKTIPLS